MRYVDGWHPTKFEIVNGELRGERSGVYLSVGSRLIGDLMARHYSAALRRHARGHFLDLGCGNVPLYAVYRDLVDDVTCVDWPGSLHRRDHVDVYANLASALPFRDSCFDTVLLSDVLEHIPNPETLTTEISRILCPGGCAIIGVPFLYHLHETPYDFNRYTRYQLERLLKNAELKVERVQEVGGSPEVLADIISKTLASRPRIANGFVAVAEWLLSRNFVKKVSVRTRQNFPLAYVAVAQKVGSASLST
jgi:SAM-dependent methyltransferase